MQRAPDRAATSKSFLAVLDRRGCRMIKLNARLTPIFGENIVTNTIITVKYDRSPGYDTTVAP